MKLQNPSSLKLLLQLGIVKVIHVAATVRMGVGLQIHCDGRMLYESMVVAFDTIAACSVRSWHDVWIKADMTGLVARSGAATLSVGSAFRHETLVQTLDLP